VISRSVCVHVPGVYAHGVYPCVAKWVTCWLYANMPACGRPYKDKDIVNEVEKMVLIDD
jgi:hypothetical protein